MNYIKTWLIPTWKQAYKYITVQLAAILVMVSFAYEYLPVLQDNLPTDYSKWIGLAIIVARIVSQPKIAAKE